MHQVDWHASLQFGTCNGQASSADQKEIGGYPVKSKMVVNEKVVLSTDGGKFA